MSPEAVIYLGPSLPRAEAAALLDAEYRAPVRRGDLAKLPSPLPRFVGIVDGEFYQSLAVSPKEILPLMEAGVAVFGASSMGALRAAELHPYGMAGVGKIFEMYRRRRIDGDDEVAMTYCPETYRTFSEPLVNLRLALAEASRQGAVPPESARRLVRKIKSVYFPDRTMNRFWREASHLLSEEQLVRLRQFFEQARPNQKADDARQLLTGIRDRSGVRP